MPEKNSAKQETVEILKQKRQILVILKIEK